MRVDIFGVEFEALLDSGAGISVTNSTDLVDRHGLKLLPSPIKICTADKTQYSCTGYVNVPVKFKGITKVIALVVVPEISRELILGINFWKAFNIKPMIQNGSNFEEIALIQTANTANTQAETFHFFLHPIETLPTLGKLDPDESLDIPGLELPGPSQATPESIETEHELTPERALLTEVIREFNTKLYCVKSRYQRGNRRIVALLPSKLR